MTKIADLTNAYVEIFNKHADKDRTLSKEGLRKIIKEASEPFDSEGLLSALMDELEEGLEGKISFEEFIECMGAIIMVFALIRERPGDLTDIPRFPPGRDAEITHYSQEETKEKMKEEAMRKVRKYIARIFGRRK
ncbi:Oidioi.mRNA.OKI2018_I69.chr2.g5465.t1.cds [Oikopleura dioica]|uniref:Oidioi.mRNA.OKI2018_I69.chr2.g5465.t1.cds n=1 Tax=Oikopleura dioica TaxID=34765 RepID=A0ABN7T3R3_OIKDI|nr:Oidioi.mRNA.OKI2018_I69.chr2.g5465.t1.cds [Oikopleura dioica]